jgi:hypothetical protein
VRVYYMTSAKWGEVILRERRLKLSRFFESNDPFELNLIDGRPKETRRYARLISNYFNKNIGMICFGRSWSSPVMWAHYADKHRGVCLGFDVSDRLLTQVTYTNQKIAVPFGTHLPKHGLTAELLSKVRLTKAMDWSYEKEFRAEAALLTPDPKTGFFYTDFGPDIQLREIILGHRCDWTIASAVQIIGKALQSVRICQAGPAFGNFEMVEMRDVPAKTVKPQRSSDLPAAANPRVRG